MRRSLKLLMGVPHFPLFLLFFFPFGVQQEEESHTDLSEHADVKDQIKVARGGAERGKREHQKAREKQRRRFLPGPYDDACDDQRYDRTVGQHAADSLCPGGRPLAGGAADDARHMLYRQIGGKALGNSERDQDARKDPDDRFPGLVEIKRIGADGKQQRDQRAVEHEAQPAERKEQRAFLHHAAERKDQRVIEKPEGHKRRQQEERLSAPLPAAQGEDDEQPFKGGDDPQHNGAGAQQDLSHKVPPCLFFIISV